MSTIVAKLQINMVLLHKNSFNIACHYNLGPLGTFVYAHWLNRDFGLSMNVESGN